MEEKEYACSSGHVKRARRRLISELWKGKLFAPLPKSDKCPPLRKRELPKLTPSAIAVIKASHISVPKGISKNINPVFLQKTNGDI